MPDRRLTTARLGFFPAFIGGKRFSKLIYEMDPPGIPEVSPEEVLLSGYGETDGDYRTAFHLADEYQKGTANSAEDAPAPFLLFSGQARQLRIMMDAL